MTLPNVHIAFRQALDGHTAGSPERADLLWTNLGLRQIADRLRQAGLDVSTRVVAQLLDRAGIPSGTPLRCITCHGGENPLVGPAAAQLLTTARNSPAFAPDGFCVVTWNHIRIDLGDWSPDPVFGGQQFDVRLLSHQVPLSLRQ